MDKVYIGDSVYMKMEADGLWLTTENGLPTDPSNKIFLDYSVYFSMVKIVDSVFKEHERHSKTPPDGDKTSG